jgi:hypothetical protein
MSQERIRRRRFFGIAAGVLVMLVVFGALWGDRALKGRGHPGLRQFIGQIARNYPKSFQVEPEVLSIQVDQAELDRLQAVVDAARQRGVIMPEGNDYVSAEITHGGVSFKARIRIKGKMTDHVKGDKWSFRVIAKKDGGFLGMKRFSLQHPGTRNYLHEWLHHRLMAGEGIVALRYGFVRLEFNGEDRGIYAYEEHFGPELLENNDRVKGPLFRFDPALFWQHRLNAMHGRRFDEPYAAEHAAALDAYGTGDLQRDPKALRLFEEAMALMNGYRSGGLTVAQVFDADRVARRLALLDLLGGHRSLDWSDAKFYYDPVLRRVEPVAYESFGGERIRGISGAGRWRGSSWPHTEVYDAWFNDEAVFRAYVHHLERVARPSYLDSALSVLAGPLDTAAATVYGEFPYKELDRAMLTHNQQVIRQVLDDPKGFHAYRQRLAGDTVELALVPIGSLPIEVHGLVARDGSVVPPAEPMVLPLRRWGRTGVPVRYTFVVPDSALADTDAMQVEHSVLGASVRKRVEVFPFALLDTDNVRPVPMSGQPLSTFPMVQVDEQAKRITFLPGTWSITNDLVIPEGYRVEGRAPLRIDLLKGARIVSRSPMLLQGREEDPVVLRSSDASGGGIFLLAHQGRSEWMHVRCEGFGGSRDRLNAGIVVQDAALDVRSSTLAEVHDRDLLMAVRADIGIAGSSVLGGRDQITLAFGTGRFANTVLGGAGDDAIVQRGGSVELKELDVTGAGGCAVKVNTMGVLRAERISLESRAKGIELAEASEATITASSIRSAKEGVDVKGVEMRYGPSVATLADVTIATDATQVRCGKGNRVKRDGKDVPVTTKEK